MACLALADVAIPRSRRASRISRQRFLPAAGGARTDAGRVRARKGSQIAVLIVPTTSGTVEQYAVRVEENWKLAARASTTACCCSSEGRPQAAHRGGYGLEGVLNDATAKRIIAEEIVRLQAE